jgi:DNA-binding NarL/FixJ family response regulator
MSRGTIEVTAHDMKQLHVTIIEDDSNYAALLAASIERSPRVQAVLHLHTTLGAALSQQSIPNHGVALVDLNLPDSTGLETLRRFRERFPQVPVVVLTGVTDDALAVECIQAGAQDHWVKTDISLRHLPQLLIYAVERYELQQQLEASRQSERQLREAMAIEQLGSAIPAPVSATVFSSAPLGQTAPDLVSSFVEMYAQLIDDAVKVRTFKTDLNVGVRVSDLASALGGHGAGPRDVIHIHTAGMRAAIPQARQTPTDAQVEEGRMLLIQVLGELVKFYRRLAGGLWRAATPGRRFGGGPGEENHGTV